MVVGLDLGASSARGKQSLSGSIFPVELLYEKGPHRMSYENFYGLKEQAFSNAPDSRFYFESSQHAEAMVRMLHAVDTMKGLTVVVGDIGAGKTLLARKALEKLEQDSQYEATLLVIVHSEITAEWMLKKIAHQLGVENV